MRTAEQLEAERRRMRRADRLYELNHTLGLVILVLACFLPAILMGLYAPTWLLALFVLPLGYFALVRPDVHGRSFTSWGLCLYNFMLGAAILITRLLFL